MKGERYIWWKLFSINLLRTFIAIRNTDPYTWGNTEKRKFAIVKPVYDSLSEHDQRIIEQYFSADWRKDQETVSKISEETGLSTEIVWIIISKAEKKVIQTMGLL